MSSAARTLWNRRIAARDGTEIAADVLLPAGVAPFPTVVLRTPYTRGRALNNARGWIRLVESGYALVAVDVRGRNDSEGDWTPWVKDTHDGHDVIEWVARQPWCSGKVGMVGGSYEGLTQWWTVVNRPQALACIAPLCVGGVQRELPFATGIPMQYWLWWMSLVAGRTRQFPGAPAWDARMAHVPLRTLDEAVGVTRSAWQMYVAGEIDFTSPSATLSTDDFARIDIPVLIGVGWWDDQEALRAWCALQSARSARDCRLLIGAWDHAGNLAPRPFLGGMDVSASAMDTIRHVERFLALHLHGEAGDGTREPRCRVFLTGANRWEDLDEWPHPRAVLQTVYLASAGDARGLRGNGLLQAEPGRSADSDTYRFDPNQPGGGMISLAAFAWSDPPLDCRYLQRRADTLVYTSEPLERPLTVSGCYDVTLFVSSDRPDTDLYVSLSDVQPDGRAIGLTAVNELSPCLRLRYRNGSQPSLLEAGAVYEVTIEGSWLHHRFDAGHRLRLTISSSNFPFMARNAGTGRHWADDTTLYPQTNTIHHSGTYPSRIRLPIVEDAR